MSKYKIRIRMNGHGTFFSYEFEAPTNEYALNHLDAIRASGYQRVSNSGEVEFFSPSMIAYIKLKCLDGEGFKQKYPDEKTLP